MCNSLHRSFCAFGQWPGTIPLSAIAPTKNAAESLPEKTMPTYTCNPVQLSCCALGPEPGAAPVSVILHRKNNANLHLQLRALIVLNINANLHQQLRKTLVLCVGTGTRGGTSVCNHGPTDTGGGEISARCGGTAGSTFLGVLDPFRCWHLQA